MQATEDGEFYPEKDLDKNYQIPKRPANQMSGNRNYNNSSSSASSVQYNASQTPLASSYYNYPYNPSAASAYYQNDSQYYQQSGQANPATNFSNQDYNAVNQITNNTASNNTGYSNYNNTNYNAASNSAGPTRNFSPPPPPPPPGTGVEPIKQNIYKALKDMKEKPKNYNKNYFQNTVQDVGDKTLPKELRAMFHPLYCKLCSASLNNTLTSKWHYKGKKHKKQISKWLTAYCENTGEPLPKRANVSSEKQQDDADKNPSSFHSDMCDLDLKGKLHAESHYMGRAHQKTPKSNVFNFQNAEDNFGGSSKSQEPISTTEVAIEPPPIFHCDLCDIKTPNQEQLDNHLWGQRHMKKLKRHDMNKYIEQRDLIDQAGQLPSQVDQKDKELDVSAYRQPNTHYHCPSCNRTIKGKKAFIGHMTSKNHAMKDAEKKLIEKAGVFFIG